MVWPTILSTKSGNYDSLCEMQKSQTFKFSSVIGRRLAMGFVASILGVAGIGIFQQKSIQDINAVSVLRAEARHAAYQLKTFQALLSDIEVKQRDELANKTGYSCWRRQSSESVDHR